MEGGDRTERADEPVVRDDDEELFYSSLGVDDTVAALNAAAWAPTR